MALTPPEKLDLIKSSARALAEERLTDIDLTLSVFDVPDNTSWDSQWSDNYEYLVARLSDATDDALIGIHAHVVEERPIPAASAQVGPWLKNHFRLFFSHTNPNKKLVTEVRTDLLDRGIDAFVAHEMIEPTKEWMEEIPIALATCEAMAALMTEDFAASAYCDQEVGFALSRDLLIIPIRQGADPHGFISRFQALPGDSSHLAAHKLAEGIFEVLATSEKTGPKLAPAIAQRYAEAHSYDDARANLGRLKEIPKDYWTPEMIELVERAGRENSQLRHGDFYDERIPAVVARHLDELLGDDRPRFPAEEGEPGWVPAPAGDDDIPF
jgi:hypothetical protein